METPLEVGNDRVELVVLEVDAVLEEEGLKEEEVRNSFFFIIPFF